jgi:hypothetical protein
MSKELHNGKFRQALSEIYGRERYAFHGREHFFGCDYLIWKLVANPWPGHAIGKRWARPL